MERLTCVQNERITNTGKMVYTTSWLSLLHETSASADDRRADTVNGIGHCRQVSRKFNIVMLGRYSKLGHRKSVLDTVFQVVIRSRSRLLSLRHHNLTVFA